MSLSFTQQEQEWIRKAYGEEPDKVFSGINSIYDNTIKTAQQQSEEQKRLLQVAYGDTVSQAKGQYDNMANLYQKAYGDQAVQLNTQYQQNTNAYGNNQNQLAQMGLTGSGYNAYLMQQAYGDYQGGKSNAYNTAEQGKMTMQQVYGDVQNQAQRDLTQGVGKANYTMQQIYGEAEQGRAMEQQNVYGQIKQEYQAKQNEYNENFAALQYDYKQGGADLDYAKFLNSSKKITDEQYKEFEGTYKTEIADKLNKEFETALNSGGDMASVFARIESEYANKLIDDEKRATYYEELARSGISSIVTKEDWQAEKTALDEYEDILGKAKYEELLGDLNKNNFSPERIETKAKLTNERKANTVAATMTGGQSSEAQSNMAMATGTGSKIRAAVIENKATQRSDIKTYPAPSGKDYHIVDKSTQYGINSASVSLGEWLEVKYPNGETDDLYVSVYASKKTKDYAKANNIQVGQLFEKDGKYYMRGANNYFKVTNVKESLFKG